MLKRNWSYYGDKNDLFKGDLKKASYFKVAGFFGES